MDHSIIHVTGKPKVCSTLRTNGVLWRYLDTAKFLDLLHNKTLFFSRGDQFEDKFEGSFTTSLKNAIKNAYEFNNIDFTYEEFRDRLRERVFVNCWHKSPHDNMAMWKIYGQSSCSVAITTTVGQLKNSLEECNLPYEIAIEKVNYVKHWTDPKINIIR